MPPKVAQIPIKKDEDSTYRYKMPKLTPRKLSSGNGVKTSLINSSDIAKAISRTQACLTQWFGYSLACQARISPATSQIVLNGDHPPKKLQDSLYEFIDNFILCPNCSNPETTMDKKGSTLVLHCHACGHTEPACPGSHSSYVQKTIDWIIAHLSSEQKQPQNVTVRGKGRLDEIEEFREQKAAEVDEGGAGIAIDVAELKKIEAEMDAKSNKKAKLTDQEELDYMNKLAQQLAGDESDMEIYNEFSNVVDTCGWSTLQRLGILFHCLFNGAPADSTLSILKDRRGFLIRVLVNEDVQKEFLQYMAKHIEKDHPELLTSAPIIWYTLFEHEIVEEGGFKQFLSTKVSKRFEETSKAKELRKSLEPFHKWLDTAEFEPEQSEDEEGHDEEQAQQTPSSSEPQSTSTSKPEEELNIDDI